MKIYVVIGFDIRGHFVIGKMFEDKNTANEFRSYLNQKLKGKMAGEELRIIDYVELYKWIMCLLNLN